MRLLGGITAFLICALWGISKAAALRMREEIMRCFSADMEALAAEMEYRPRNIRDMADKLQGGQLRGFWSRFSDGVDQAQSGELAWQRAAEEYDGFEVLSVRERQLITEAGRAIGQRNMESSIKALEYWGKEAGKHAEELRKQSVNKGTVYRKLGLMGGLAVMLLII